MPIRTNTGQEWRECTTAFGLADTPHMRQAFAIGVRYAANASRGREQTQECADAREHDLPDRDRQGRRRRGRACPLAGRGGSSGGAIERRLAPGWPF